MLGEEKTHFVVNLDLINNFKGNDILWGSWCAVVTAVTILIQNQWSKWFSGWVSFDK